MRRLPRQLYLWNSGRKQLSGFDRKGNTGNHGGTDIRDGLSQEDAQQAQPGPGQDERQWDEQNDLAQHGDEDGDSCLTNSHEGLLYGHRRARDDKAGQKDAHAPGGQFSQRRIVVEDGDIQPGKEHYAGPQNSRKAQGGQQKQLEGPFDPLHAARPIVIADDGLGPLPQLSLIHI